MRFWVEIRLKVNTRGRPYFQAEVYPLPGDRNNPTFVVDSNEFGPEPTTMNMARLALRRKVRFACEDYADAIKIVNAGDFSDYQFEVSVNEK